MYWTTSVLGDQGITLPLPPGALRSWCAKVDKYHAVVASHEAEMREIQARGARASDPGGPRGAEVGGESIRRWKDTIASSSLPKKER